MAYDDGNYGRPQMQFAFPPFRGWVKRLILINAGIFLFLFFAGMAFPAIERIVPEWFGLNPRDWSGVPHVWQALTYGFLHSGTDIGHLFFNMLALYFFGEMVQSAVGDRRFLTHYLIAVVAGAALHLAFAAVSVRFSVPTIGASGAVSAMIVAAAVMRPHATVIFILFPVKLWVLAAISVGLDVFGLLNELKTGFSDGVAHTVHLGGAAYGYLAVKRRWIFADPLAVIERKRAVRKVQQEIGDDARMDQIMAKISREGIGSLTRSERNFMQRQSERRRQK